MSDRFKKQNAPVVSMACRDALHTFCPFWVCGARCTCDCHKQRPLATAMKPVLNARPLQDSDTDPDQEKGTQDG